MPFTPNNGFFQILSPEIVRHIFSFAPSSKWFKLNKYFNKVVLLAVSEKVLDKALVFAAKKNYLNLLDNLLVR